MFRRAHFVLFLVGIATLIGCSTPDGFHYGSSPIFLRDAKSIIAAVRHGGTSRIYRLSLNGDPAVPLSGGADEWPAVSPDERLLVFSRTSSSGGANLWTIDISTGSERQLTRSSSNDISPVFVSPTKVVFRRALRYRSTSTFGMTWDDWDLFAFDLATGKEDSLTDERYYALDLPTFCEEWQAVVTSAEDLKMPAPQFIAVNIVDKSQRILVDSGRVGSERLSNPKISSDCKRTMYVKAQMDTDQDGWTPYDIYVADNAFLHPSRLAHPGTYITTATFAGSNRIVFGADSKRNHVVEMFTADIPDTPVRLVVQMP